MGDPFRDCPPSQSEERIAELALTPEGRLSVIGALLAAVPLPALNRGDVWTVGVIQTVYALANVADWDLANVLARWATVVADAPLTYVVRVRTALEET